MRALDRRTHRGLWAAVPTPWDQSNRLDAGVLRRNCERLANANVDGIYTTDSDGEFYAIELDEFKQLAKAFGRAMEATKVDAAMGVTWSSTQGTIDRIKASCDAGIVNVHVALPTFMPLAKPDVDRFFDDLASAAPQARWIHYAYPRCGPRLNGHAYCRLADQFPEQFIGTKLPDAHITDLTEILIHAPQLSHLVVDTTMGPAMMLGAQGCCSYWVNTLPHWHRAFMDACVAGRWEEVLAYHRKLIEWELTHVPPLREAGHRHGIIGKARGALSGFLEDSGVTRAPYYPASQEIQDALRAAFEAYWKDELSRETWLNE